MMQLITLLGLALEILVLGVVVYFARQQGFTILLALLLCLCLAVTWRLGICLFHSFVAGAMRRLAGTANPLGNSVKAFLLETRAKLISMTVLQPFQNLIMGAEPASINAEVSATAKPIVLLHGYVCNRGIWWWFRKNLQRLHPNATIYSLTIEPVFGSIDDCALQLRAALERIRAQHPNQPMTIITHSMGGLTLRAYLRHCANAAKDANADNKFKQFNASNGYGIGKVFCLGAPHAGTEFARLGFGTCVKQMRRNSPWLNALEDFEAMNPPLMPIVCIYTLNEDIAYPAESGILVMRSPAVQIEAIAVSAVGHVSLLFSRDVLSLVHKRI